MWLAASLMGVALPLLLWLIVRRSDRRHHEARMRLIQKRIDARTNLADRSEGSADERVK